MALVFDLQSFSLLFRGAAVSSRLNEAKEMDGLPCPVTEVKISLLRGLHVYLKNTQEWQIKTLKKFFAVCN